MAAAPSAEPRLLATLTYTGKRRIGSGGLARVCKRLAASLVRPISVNVDRWQEQTYDPRRANETAYPY